MNIKALSDSLTYKEGAWVYIPVSTDDPHLARMGVTWKTSGLFKNADVYSLASLRDSFNFDSEKPIPKKEIETTLKRGFKNIDGFDDLVADLSKKFRYYLQHIVVPAAVEAHDSKTDFTISLLRMKSSSELVATICSRLDETTFSHNGVDVIITLSSVEAFEKDDNSWFDFDGYEEYMHSKGMTDDKIEYWLEQARKNWKRFKDNGSSVSGGLPENSARHIWSKFIKGLVKTKEGFTNDSDVAVAIDDMYTSGLTVRSMKSALGVESGLMFGLTLFQG
jgi:hypothetical protein